MTSTPTRPVDNVVITTKGLQDRNIHIIDGTMVENKGKLILTEIFPSMQKALYLKVFHLSVCMLMWQSYIKNNVSNPKIHAYVSFKLYLEF